MGHVMNNSYWAGAYFREGPILDPQPVPIKRMASARHGNTDVAGAARREPLVLAVEDQTHFSPGLQTICTFLGIQFELVSSDRDLAPMLKLRRPMAVFCEFDGPWQDGCHIMKIVSEHDRTLPVLVVTGDDPSLLGAAQAVEEIFHLTGVMACQRLPAIGELVEFLFSAGRKGRCLSLMPG